MVKSTLKLYGPPKDATTLALKRYHENTCKNIPIFTFASGPHFLVKISYKLWNCSFLSYPTSKSIVRRSHIFHLAKFLVDLKSTNIYFDFFAFYEIFAQYSYMVCKLSSPESCTHILSTCAITPIIKAWSEEGNSCKAPWYVFNGVKSMCYMSFVC